MVRQNWPAHDLKHSKVKSDHFPPTASTTNMSLNSGSGTPGSPKRAHDDTQSSGGPETKRIKLETNDEPAEDSHFGGLFDPLPFETENGAAEFPLDNADLDLPNFLSSEKPHDLNGGARTASMNSPAVAQMGSNSAPVTTAPSAGGSGVSTPGNSSQNLNSAAYQPGLSRVNPLGRIPDKTNPGGYAVTDPSAVSMYQSQPQSNISYPGYQSTYPNQYRPGAPTYKPSIRFDSKKTYPTPTGMSGSALPQGMYNSTNQDKSKDDPSKLNDAIAAAGVDIQREEELLSTHYNRSALNLHQQQLANRQRQTYGLLNAFLHPYHVALFMNRTARENGVVQNFMMDTEMLEYMSAACKEWLSSIVTKTTTLARHRRRGIPALNGKGQAGKQKAIPPSQRSEVSKELRNLALRQKELEERRVAKRMALGLEMNDDVAPETANKAGAEETLHRAANATAAMMTMNPKKKYSWMTAGSGGATEDIKASATKDGGGKQSTLLSTRGDNGLRFREIRTGNMVTTKDLLGVLEEERMGTSKAVIKGYAKLKD